MRETKMLIDKVRDRLNLTIYSDWERRFLINVVKQFDKHHRLTIKQYEKLREVIRERWIQGLSPRRKRYGEEDDY